MPIEKGHIAVASCGQDSPSLADSAFSSGSSSSSKTSITSSSSPKRRSEGDLIHNNAGLSIEHLGTVTSGLQFEPCRFPTASVSLCKSEIGFASIPVTALKDVLPHTSSTDSQIQFLKVAWALLLSNYVRDSYVAFGFIDGQGFDSDFTKAIVCSFGACPSK